ADHAARRRAGALADGTVLFERQIFTFPMIFPVVPRDAARLRFFLSAAHDDAQIDRAVEVLADCQAALGAPPAPARAPAPARPLAEAQE
ncbi:MAG: hypothetical protein AAFZ09_10270, partial [Pseudomonadota bacterium]